ncbi:MAG: hypothetical protein HC788_03630 [Sphingopyxis sp.]|nr:hypothetical protein [Sphingopyxis sp.]
MAIAIAACIWLLLDHPLFAPPPLPPPAPTGAFDTPADSLTYLEALRASRPREAMVSTG